MRTGMRSMRSEIPPASGTQVRIVVLGRADDLLDAVLGDEIAAAGAALDAELGEMQRA